MAVKMLLLTIAEPVLEGHLRHPTRDVKTSSFRMYAKIYPAEDRRTVLIFSVR